ncbi:MAG: hypothetical protein COA42_06160 [Alteromonadaceae bacterium]|nr:MAG: hypothetical protein COA42_06160 [Alteromonadaceae bacterium]
MADFIVLQHKDNDKKMVWGGKTLKAAPEYTIKSLQNDLKSVGVATGTADGDFGGKTRKAVKLFQWACANATAYAKNNSNITRTVKSAISVTGKLDKATSDELKTWVSNKQITTGDLVIVAFSEFGKIEKSSGFKKIASTSVLENEIIISSGALQLLKDLNSQAKAKKVTIKINQAFRVHGVKVTGAVVPPASKSQHLIGHAIDCNIVDGDNWNNIKTFKNNKASDNAKKLIKKLKELSYRWGGDFTKVDTPHFDKKLSSTEFSYDAKFFFNQRMVSESQAIPKKTIPKEA